jgi:glycine betaine/choline ABC-type transport system substrate-binding protein
MQRIKQALDFALVKHYNQKYGKAPYITHLFGVASRMETESEIIVALLHDVLEDTDCTVLELISECKLTDTEILVINLLNKNNYKDYWEYIDGIKKNKLATKVKLSDLRYNLESTKNEMESRITLKSAEREFKYQTAILILDQ